MRIYAQILAMVVSAAAFTASGQTHSGITYADTDPNSHKLDIYMPSGGTAPYPVVVWIHGGAFKSGSRTDGNASQLASMLGPVGIAVVSIDYRLSGVAKWPAQIQDCKAVVRWVRANAATYKFNPDRIGSAGGSAGGHLAAMLGLAGNVKTFTIGQATMDIEGTIGGNRQYSSGVQAVLDMYGPANFLTLNSACPTNSPTVSSQDHDAADSPESALIGGKIQQFPDSAKLASPVSYVSSDDPPFLILHGNRDPLIVSCQSVELSTLLKAAFAANKKECTFIQYSSQSHGFNVTTGRDSVIAFFTRHLLSPTPVAGQQAKAYALFAPKIWTDGSCINIAGPRAFTFCIADAQGRVIYKQRFDATASNTFHSVEMSAGGPGVRFCKVSDSRSQQTFSVMVMGR